jgi:putative spermidine/putrescine transport system substrate-binding protein
MRSRLALALGVALLASGCRRDAPSTMDVRTAPWSDVVAAARGTTVQWRMWRGDPLINAYLDEWVAPRLAAEFGITLRAIEGQGPEIVNQLRLEQTSGARGTADLVWINGETFAALQRDSLLFGPWAGRLPAAALVDSASPIVSRDFERQPDGFESPWGRVQFALIYDTLRTPTPPRTVAELERWILAHPGRFTHDQGFTGATFHKIVLYATNGGVASLQGGFTEAKWETASPALFAWLERTRPAFWRGGTAFPPGVADLHRLFANGEVDFSMSNNQHEVLAKIRQGILPATARALLLHDGTIANSHFLGIPRNAANAAGAMVVADFLLRPEAQFEKARPEVWADGSVLAHARLPADWRARFDSLRLASDGLAADSLARYARPEIAAAWHDRVVSEWRTRIRATTP